MSHAAREHGNVTVFSVSVSSFVLSLLLSHAETKRYFSIILPLVSHNLCGFCIHPWTLPPFLLFLLSVSPSGEPVSECRRYVQVRNITKGDCRLDNVEVSFCRGRCLSRTDVTLEVSRDIYTHTEDITLPTWGLLTSIDLNKIDNWNIIKVNADSKVD